MVRIYPLMSIALLLILSGCVSSSKYNLLKAELVGTKQENRVLARNVLLMEKEYVAGIANSETRSETMAEIVDELKDEVDAEMSKVNLQENNLHIEVVNRLLYESGSAVIKPEEREVLARIAPILKRAEGETIRVAGHTDPLPPSARLRKRYPSNWDLSNIIDI